MAAKAKTLKSKIKVEEILDEHVETKIPDEIPAEDETPIPPKVTSFSQLDAIKAAEVKTQEDPETRKGSSILTPPTPSENKEQQISEPEPTVETPLVPQAELSSEDVKEWLRDVRPDTTKEVEKGRKPNLKAVVLVVLVFLVLGALAGGLYYYKSSLSRSEVVMLPKDETIVEVTPSPAKAPEVELSSLSVSVLNGSGVKGEAARVKQMLVEKGFSEEKVTAGNADKSNYKETLVSIKKGQSESVYMKLEEVLGADFTLEKSETDLEDSSSFDVVIIAGTKK